MPPKAPFAKIGEITDTGQVTINFSEDMMVVPDLNLIKSSTITDGSGTKRPSFNFKVIVGAYSQPEMLAYSWSVTGMTKRSLLLQINFQKPI